MHVIIQYLQYNNGVTAILCRSKNDNSDGVAMTQQIELFDIANPCISVCTSNKKSYCFGRLRSRTERHLWLSMTNEQRREVIRLVAGHKQRIEQLKDQQLGFDFEEVVEVGELF